MYPRLLELGPLTVYTYGVLLAAAYLLGLKLAMVRAKSRNLDQTRFLDLGIYIIISALVGAKLLCPPSDGIGLYVFPSQKSIASPRPVPAAISAIAPLVLGGVPAFKTSASSGLNTSIP